MELTRYGQSGVIIQTNGKRILVDPSTYRWEESCLKDNLKNIDVLLVTHKHSDHCNELALKNIFTNSNVKFFTSQEVAKSIPEYSPKIVKVGDVIEFDSLKIEVVKAIHGFIHSLKGGKEIFENIGFIIDDGKKRVYITGDTICFDNDYKCDVVFVPVCNHGLVMGTFEAALFAKATGASLVIPNHYDNLERTI